MYKPNILVYNPKEAETYARFLRDHGYKSIFTASNPEEALNHLSEVEVVFGWKFPTGLLSSPSALNVRWFQSMGAGVDDLITDPSIPESITITRVVDLFGRPIAEYVFAYLLYLTKGIERIRSSQSRQAWEPFVSDSLISKKIGVAGLGSIGIEMVRMARTFEMTVHGLSSRGKQADIVDRHFTSSQWFEFVRELDILVLTLPLTKDTHHAVNKEILYAMKEDAILINVGRGKLIVQDELVDVLASGHLGAAVLDVFEEEPLPADNPLWSMPNVFVTPHLSGPSTPLSVGKYFVQNLLRYELGQPLEGIVSRSHGY